MTTLSTSISDILASSLQRSSIKSCSRWSTNYRVMGPPVPGLWGYKYHPWLKDIEDSDAIYNKARKAAQLGFTEAALNKTLFKIDVLREDCLYILPATNPDAADFSSSRFDCAIELSEHLKNLFSDTKNVGHKRAGSTNLYVRGSRSKSGLKSIPVSFIVFDEVDEMTQENIPLAIERTSGRFHKQFYFISTPTVPGFGISELYNDSNQQIFTFPCPKCSKITRLDFPDCLVVTAESLADPRITDSHIICPECRGKLPHQTKFEYLKDGKWSKTKTHQDNGWTLSQLYSSTVSPVELARSFLLGETNPYDKQEFHNSKGGVPFIVDGARITEDNVKKCIQNYKSGPSSGFITMGIDVGTWLHYEIVSWYDLSGRDLNLNAKGKTLSAGKVKDFAQLDVLMREYQVNSCVIDANPERREATKFCDRFPKNTKMCFYGYNQGAKRLIIDHNEAYKITADRTYWLDIALGRIKSGAIVFPSDLTLEYIAGVQRITRSYAKDKEGNPVGIYIGEEGDHFAHTRCYAEIALPIGYCQRHNTNIDRVL